MHGRALYLLPALFAVAAAGSLTACGGVGSLPGSAATAASQASHGPPPGKLFSWLQPGIDSTHAADNTAEKKLKKSNVAKLKEAWSFATGAQIGNPLVTDGNTAFVDSGDGYLYAVNVATGTQKWRFETYWGDAWASSPAIGGKLVYVPCLVGGNTQQNGLCALDESSGKLKWSYYDDCNCLPPSAVEEGPVVSGSTVVLGYYDRNVYLNYTMVALDSSTGAVLWQVLAGSKSPYGYGLANSTPAIDGGNVFAGTSAGICSYQLANGGVNWCSGPDDGGTAPAVSKGAVYVNTFSHGFYALNESTGAQIWQYTPQAGNGGGYDDPPAVANGTVYFSGIGFNANLYALNASNGTLLYDTSGDGAGAETYSSPSVANGVVYTACSAGLCAFNASNGSLLYSSNGSGSSQGTPAIASGTVYTICGSNDACAYGL